jgi:predicted AAA+ superfamily ATPase
MFLRLIKPTKTNSCFIFGARGTGKSTYLGAQKLQNSVFINLLDQPVYRRYRHDPSLLKDDLKKIDPAKSVVVIDEVQKIPQLLDVVHDLIESRKIKFILTGSSARKLKRGAANLLAGRALQYFMFPMTAVELGDQFDLQSVMEWGALPKIFALEGEDRADYLKTYAGTYLKEEVLEEQLTRSTFAFRNFLEVAAQENGNTLNFSKIAKDLNVDPKTAQGFFQILEDTLVGFFLPAYHRSVRKSVKLQPKFYLFDLGVKRALEHSLHQPLNPSTKAYGRAFEHFVICEIMRINSYRKLDYQLSHYQTYAGGEIDLVLYRGREVIAIEIKSYTTVDKSDAKHLQALAESLKPTKCYLISQDRNPIVVDDVVCCHYLDFLTQELGVAQK